MCVALNRAILDNKTMHGYIFKSRREIRETANSALNNYLRIHRWLTVDLVIVQADLVAALELASKLTQSDFELIGHYRQQIRAADLCAALDQTISLIELGDNSATVVTVARIYKSLSQYLALQQSSPETDEETRTLRALITHLTEAAEMRQLAARLTTALEVVKAMLGSDEKQVEKAGAAELKAISRNRPLSFLLTVLDTLNLKTPQSQ